LERADLDPERRRRRELAPPGERGVQIGNRNDGESPDVLLGLGERAVGHGHRGIPPSQHGGRLGRVKAAREHPCSGRAEFLIGVSHIRHDLVQVAGRKFSRGLVDTEQVVVHLFTVAFL
jgi:hypothetical protein